MATTTITALSAGTALAGTEVAAFDQGASTVKITATQIKTWTSASPTLVTPALGTPSSGTLTSCTGLPAAGVVGTAAILGANTFTALQTITQASANAGIIASTGYSLTGSNATAMLDFAGTWNTTGNPVALKVAMTNTASGSTSKFVSFLAGASGTTEVHSVAKNGAISITGTSASEAFLTANDVSLRQRTTSNSLLDIYAGSTWMCEFQGGGGGLLLYATQLPKIGFSSQSSPGNADIAIQRTTAGVLRVTDGTTGGGALEFLEQTAPAAGAANTARIYAVDNGAGKTQLMVLFNSGAAQQIAIEP